MKVRRYGMMEGFLATLKTRNAKQARKQGKRFTLCGCGGDEGTLLTEDLERSHPAALVLTVSLSVGMKVRNFRLLVD